MKTVKPNVAKFTQVDSFYGKHVSALSHAIELGGFKVSKDKILNMIDQRVASLNTLRRAAVSKGYVDLEEATNTLGVSVQKFLENVT